MSEVRHLEVAPCSAHAFSVPPRARVRVTDLQGGQPGDLVAFSADDLLVRLSAARTRVENGKVTVTAGDGLWSNAQPPGVLLTMVEDTCEGHDLLYAPCCRYALRERFGVDRDGCLELLLEALAPWGVALHEVPDPVNLFFRVLVDARGRLRIGPRPSTAGDFVELRAEAACVVAVSACPAPRPDGPNTGFAVRVAT